MKPWQERALIGLALALVTLAVWHGYAVRPPRVETDAVLDCPAGFSRWRAMCVQWPEGAEWIGEAR